MHEDEMRRRLRAARAYAGYGAERLADEAGLSLGAVRKMEAGDRYPTEAVLAKIAKACGLPLEFFRVDFGALDQEAAMAVMAAELARVADRLARLESQRR